MLTPFEKDLELIQLQSSLRRLAQHMLETNPGACHHSVALSLVNIMCFEIMMQWCMDGVPEKE
jgi:hypothetical protein